MKSKRTREFRERYDALPVSVQRQADKAFAQFQEDPDYAGLNFKQVSSDPVWYSVRVGLSYRAVCVRSDDGYIWFWIGSHADYDKLLKHK